jgi:hypothetical protein
MKIFVPFTLLTIVGLLTSRPGLAQTSTGNTNAATAADVALGGSSFTWNSPNGALAAGGATANTAALLSAFTGKTDYLQLTNFGFNVPTGSTIDGIQVNVTKVASGLNLTIGILSITGSVNDNIVQLIGPGVTSTNKATGANWPTSNTTTAYGSTSDTWGGTPWTAAMVNSAGFGVQFSANMVGGVLLGVDLVPSAAIDNITVNITYSLPTVLALGLEKWSATPTGTANLLSWQSSADEEPGTFIVERSANSTDWTPLATIGTRPGAQTYSYLDPAPFASGPTCYRLRLQSAGQPDSWSSVQAVSARLFRPVISLYPNPVHDNINISAPGGFSRVILTSPQGVTLLVREFPGGINSTQIPMTGLPQGLYFLTVDGATYQLVKS